MSVAALVSLALAACGSNSPVEVIVKPGITAIEQSSALACDADRLTLETAIENFTLLNVDPPAAESDLVPDWLRSESQLYDLVDGQVVPAPDSGCPAGTAATAAAADPSDPAAAPATTSGDGTVPVDLGECEKQHKVLEVAMAAYFTATGSPAASEADLLPEYLVTEISGYDVVDGTIVPAPASPCP